MQASQDPDDWAILRQSETEPFIAACVQAARVNFDPRRTLEKVRALAAEAAGMGAKVVLFPEAFVVGYPRGASFGAVVGSRAQWFATSSSPSTI